MPNIFNSFDKWQARAACYETASQKIINFFIKTQCSSIKISNILCCDLTSWHIWTSSPYVSVSTSGSRNIFLKYSPKITRRIIICYNDNLSIPPGHSKSQLPTGSPDYLSEVPCSRRELSSIVVVQLDFLVPAVNRLIPLKDPVPVFIQRFSPKCRGWLCCISWGFWWDDQPTSGPLQTPKNYVVGF